MDAVSKAVQGGENVRQIDADALCAISWKREGSKEYAKGFRHGVGFVMNEIEKAPTIDAIPVEWMRDKMRGYASALKSTELKALVTVMQMWQKEQEENGE